MKVFKVRTNDTTPPALIEAGHYYEDGSFMNFIIKRTVSRKEYAVTVASFNKMSIASVVMIAESIGISEVSGKHTYEYTGTEPKGSDAKAIEELNSIFR